MGNPGSSLELVAADITQRATLLPEMFADVRALVIATAVKVAPKEGDTADRAKYRQVCATCLVIASARNALPWVHVGREAAATASRRAGPSLPGRLQALLVDCHTLVSPETCFKECGVT